MLEKQLEDREAQIDCLSGENEELASLHENAMKSLNESYDLISAKDRQIASLESHLVIKN